MPYRIVHRKKAPDGKAWCVDYRKGGRWHRLGCTTSREKAKAMIRAVEAEKAREGR